MVKRWKFKGSIVERNSRVSFWGFLHLRRFQFKKSESKKGNVKKLYEIIFLKTKILVSTKLPESGILILVSLRYSVLSFELWGMVTGMIRCAGRLHIIYNSLIIVFRRHLPDINEIRLNCKQQNY